ncbi:MAG: Cholera toxin secretion protein epsL [Pseudomonadota bacterium]
MAATLLKRPTLIRVPPRSVGERALAGEAVLGVVDGDTGEDRRVSLDALPDAKSLALVFDARDVTLLRIVPPPLSGKRLAQAIPNLLEDLLLQDPATCAVALGPAMSGGERLVAVIDRAWFEFALGAFERRGFRIEAAWPAQLLLPVSPANWSVRASDDVLVLRTSGTDGFGWTLPGEPEEREAAIADALQAAMSGGDRPARVDALAPQADDAAMLGRVLAGLGVPSSAVPAFVPDRSPVDLLAARSGTAGSRWMAGVDWRAWRTPAAMGLACLFAFLAGLNLHWAALSRERAELRARMETVFRETFPAAQVVIDPVLQMQRQVADLRLGAGRSGPADFLPLLVRFSEALGPGMRDGFASIDYRDGRLKARPLGAGGLDEPAREALRAAGRQRGLKIDFEGEAASATIVVGPQP